MQTLSLCNGWEACLSAPAAADSSPENAPADGWFPVLVPGDINAALRNLGRLPDPHYGDNIRSYYPLTAQEVWMRKRFDARADLRQELELVFEGIDGTAQIWLNGFPLGTARNAFRPHRFPAGRALRAGANELLLRFPSIDKLLCGPREDMQTGWGTRRARLRKPQFNMGWNWAPPVPSLGLFKGVSLCSRPRESFADCFVRSQPDGQVEFAFETALFDAAQEYEIRFEVFGEDFAHSEAQTCKHPKTFFRFRVPQPRLWWPNGYGGQPLYSYKAALLCGGVCVDAREGRFAFRTVSVLEEPFTADAGEGRSFWFIVNGKRIFIKGSNWVPTELWPAESTPEQYEFYIEKAREAGFTMLRVWGGGIYERDLFYELCDAAGILVWQDFMFASAGFPFDLLRDEIMSEACWQLMRLRNHPCIALWCGCNENFTSWKGYESAYTTYRSGNDRLSAMQSASEARVFSADGVQPDIESAGAERVDRAHDDPLLYTMLRGLVSRYAPGTPYTESSPQSFEDTGNLPNSGNSHISCWKYALFETGGQYDRWRDHFEKVCSFDSEFCIQGPCSKAALCAFMPSEHLWPPDEMWTRHIQRGHHDLPHAQQTLWIAGATFGEIHTLEDYIRFGQATHLEQTRAEYESARQDYPSSGGTMSWMFNDCWPTANWSVIEYGRQPKPAYYAAKRASAPLLPIIFERGGLVSFSLSNQTCAMVEAALTYGASTLCGDETASFCAQLRVPACETVCFCQMPREQMPHAANEYWFIRLTAGSAALPTVVYFPNMWKNVPFAPSHPKILRIGERQDADGWRYTLLVGAEGFARLVHLHSPEKDAWFSDNWFDLPAGETAAVELCAKERVAPGAIRCDDWFDWD